MSMDAQLPEFENPPVVEVALAVQFEPIAALTAPQLGLIWAKQFRKGYPKVEEHAPLDSVTERFGTKGPGQADVRIQVLDKPPTPRCWFLNDDGSELIQVQPDRFAHNWRKTGGGSGYPRYDKHIKKNFVAEVTSFQNHIEEEELGTFTPNQCEVTYVNHIPCGTGWESHAQLARIVSLGELQIAEGFLPEPEELRMSGSFVIPGENGAPLGRLRFSIEPAIRRADNAPIFRLNLVARGRPVGEGISGILGFMDIGREWIVRGFTAITTPEMHRIWGRTQ